MDAKRFENFTAELFAQAGDPVSVVEPVYDVIGDLVAEDKVCTLDPFPPALTCPCQPPIPMEVIFRKQTTQCLPPPRTGPRPWGEGGGGGGGEAQV
jgi:hypothetical protein